ncbi:hypothetical protein [Bombella saccharophila]|uniref:Uncharacterized protein n=1 Tax=Bombella saccharophila TaxID=2967338 RepID=A0ABT3WBV3_9PROT|nr:hypothetical protein [Bombella saccharophila]MCX5614441.1 hypothetical protein [Bombella saccharophila]
MNVSDPLALVMGAKLATLHELKTIYDSEDMWLLWEIAAVERVNGNS